jgi:hypothetical protein
VLLKLTHQPFGGFAVDAGRAIACEARQQRAVFGVTDGAQDAAIEQDLQCDVQIVEFGAAHLRFQENDDFVHDASPDLEDGAPGTEHCRACANARAALAAFCAMMSAARSRAAPWSGSTKLAHCREAAPPVSGQGSIRTDGAKRQRQARC